MNKLTTTFLMALLCLSSFTAFSQSSLVDYDWFLNPKYEVPEEADEYSEIVIKDKRIVEFKVKYSGYYSTGIEEYNLQHKITYIASEAGVEDNNKVYLTTSDDDILLIKKARVINSKGEEIELNENDIQKGVDEKNGYNITYFALDGLDIGSFVEIIVLLKKRARFDGSKVTLQSTVPKYDVEFQLIAPEKVLFSFLSTNGLPEIELIDEPYKKNYYKLSVPKMEAFQDEPNSFTQSSLQSILYKIDQNEATGAKNMVSYAKVANDYYDYMYKDFNKSEAKAIEKLIEGLGVSENESSLSKFAKLEHYVKENFAIVNDANIEDGDIKLLFSKKAAPLSTFVKLYANACKILDIPHEIVLTSDRTINRFETNYQSNIFLRTPLIYLTEEDKYLSPEANWLRLGYVPWEYTETYGLFIEEVKAGNYYSAIGRVDFIKALDYKHSSNNQFITVDMSEDPNEPYISYDIQRTGYRSGYMQNVYPQLSDEEKKRTKEDLIERIFSEEDIDNLTILNASPEAFGKQPLRLQIAANTIDYTEKAGNKILFKVGDLIGLQSDLYKEKERRNPVEINYNKTFDRKIEVILPDDYEISNLDKLNFDVRMDDDSAIFTSKYTLNGNRLVIDMNEYYDKINYGIEDYENFKAVVNAAADFNKVVLYLTEK